jgi:hypothetical protein
LSDLLPVALAPSLVKAHAALDCREQSPLLAKPLDAEEGIEMPRMIIVGGGFGTDAGGWWIDENGELHRIPGWEPESALEVQRAMTIIREAVQLKTPGLMEATAKTAIDFVQQEITRIAGEADIVVFG